MLNRIFKDSILLELPDKKIDIGFLFDFSVHSLKVVMLLGLDEQILSFPLRLVFIRDHILIREPFTVGDAIIISKS